MPLPFTVTVTTLPPRLVLLHYRSPHHHHARLHRTCGYTYRGLLRVTSSTVPVCYIHFPCLYTRLPTGYVHGYTFATFTFRLHHRLHVYGYTHVRSCRLFITFCVRCAIYCVHWLVLVYGYVVTVPVYYTRFDFTFTVTVTTLRLRLFTRSHLHRLLHRLYVAAVTRYHRTRLRSYACLPLHTFTVTAHGSFAGSHFPVYILRTLPLRFGSHPHLTTYVTWFTTFACTFVLRAVGYVTFRFTVTLRLYTVTVYVYLRSPAARCRYAVTGYVCSLFRFARLPFTCGSTFTRTTWFCVWLRLLRTLPRAVTIHAVTGWLGSFGSFYAAWLPAFGSFATRPFAFCGCGLYNTYTATHARFTVHHTVTHAPRFLPAHHVLTPSHPRCLRTLIPTLYVWIQLPPRYRLVHLWFGSPLRGLPTGWLPVHACHAHFHGWITQFTTVTTYVAVAVARMRCLRFTHAVTVGYAHCGCTHTGLRVWVCVLPRSSRRYLGYGFIYLPAVLYRVAPALRFATPAVRLRFSRTPAGCSCRFTFTYRLRFLPFFTIHCRSHTVYVCHVRRTCGCRFTVYTAGYALHTFWFIPHLRFTRSRFGLRTARLRTRILLPADHIPLRLLVTLHTRFYVAFCGYCYHWFTCRSTICGLRLPCTVLRGFCHTLRLLYAGLRYRVYLPAGCCSTHATYTRTTLRRGYYATCRYRTRFTYVRAVAATRLPRCTTVTVYTRFGSFCTWFTVAVTVYLTAHGYLPRLPALHAFTTFDFTVRLLRLVGSTYHTRSPPRAFLYLVCRLPFGSRFWLPRLDYTRFAFAVRTVRCGYHTHVYTFTLDARIRVRLPVTGSATRYGSVTFCLHFGCIHGCRACTHTAQYIPAVRLVTYIRLHTCLHGRSCYRTYTVVYGLRLVTVVTVYAVVTCLAGYHTYVYCVRSRLLCHGCYRTLYGSWLVAVRLRCSLPFWLRLRDYRSHLVTRSVLGHTPLVTAIVYATPFPHYAVLPHPVPFTTHFTVPGLLRFFSSTIWVVTFTCTFILFIAAVLPRLHRTGSHAFTCRMPIHLYTRTRYTFGLVHALVLPVPVTWFCLPRITAFGL